METSIEDEKSLRKIVIVTKSRPENVAQASTLEIEDLSNTPISDKKSEDIIFKNDNRVVIKINTGNDNSYSHSQITRTEQELAKLRDPLGLACAEIKFENVDFEESNKENTFPHSGNLMNISTTRIEEPCNCHQSGLQEAHHKRRTSHQQLPDIHNNINSIVPKLCGPESEPELETRTSFCNIKLGGIASLRQYLIPKRTPKTSCFLSDRSNRTDDNFYSAQSLMCNSISSGVMAPSNCHMEANSGSSSNYLNTEGENDPCRSHSLKYLSSENFIHSSQMPNHFSAERSNVNTNCDYHQYLSQDGTVFCHSQPFYSMRPNEQSCTVDRNESIDSSNLAEPSCNQIQMESSDFQKISTPVHSAVQSGSFFNLNQTEPLNIADKSDTVNSTTSHHMVIDGTTSLSNVACNSHEDSSACTKFQSEQINSTSKDAILNDENNSLYPLNYTISVPDMPWVVTEINKSDLSSTEVPQVPLQGLFHMNPNESLYLGHEIENILLNFSQQIKCHTVALANARSIYNILEITNAYFPFSVQEKLVSCMVYGGIVSRYPLVIPQKLRRSYHLQLSLPILIAIVIPRHPELPIDLDPRAYLEPLKIKCGLLDDEPKKYADKLLTSLHKLEYRETGMSQQWAVAALFRAIRSSKRSHPSALAKLKNYVKTQKVLSYAMIRLGGKKESGKSSIE